MKIMSTNPLKPQIMRRIAQQITALEKAGADMIHLDIMDGHFAFGDNVPTWDR